MGAAGDMLMSALLELVPDKDKFVEKINNIGISNVKVKLESSVKCGIKGNHVRVLINDEEELSEDVHNSDELHHHNHTHHHAHYHATIDFIEHTIQNLAVSDKVKNDVISIYKLIAQAESKAHGVDVSEIHFHEVGMMDAIADVTCCAMLMEEINPDKVVVSPINTGFGKVKCAHGILPVPAPATANLLEGMVCYSGNIEGELCTPTGAAILKYYVNEFGNMPAMIMEKQGYGMGNKDFPVANCIRAILGEKTENNSITESNNDTNQNNRTIENSDTIQDTIVELRCNIDDMTAEELSFAVEQIWQDDVLDVYTTPISMKKGRQGTLLNVMCKESAKEDVAVTIFKHTSTIGIREYKCSRMILNRKIEKVSTQYGDIDVKKTYGYGVEKSKLEFEDLKKIAIENCPMLFTEDEWPGGKNLAISPAIWRELFKRLPSDMLGLNFDPSHFIWQEMDYIKPLYEFKDKIFHVHYKDIKVNKDARNDVGILATPLSYMLPCIPGHGDVDWSEYIRVLLETGYKGAACIEIEDKSFENDKESIENSLKISRQYLKQFINFPEKGKKYEED